MSDQETAPKEKTTGTGGAPAADAARGWVARVVTGIEDGV
jgi:hypothetical protein